MSAWCGWAVLRAGAVLVAPLILAGCGDDGPRAPATTPSAPASITVTSTAFTEGQPIPKDNTCGGAGNAPALSWRGVPAGAKSLALVVDDPDASGGTYIHWVVYNLPAADGGLPSAELPAGARTAENTGGLPGWTAPCPPSGTHHYRFTVYALPAPVTAESTLDILDELNRTAVARGTLTGLASGG